jgi:hypothetical protein
MTDIFRPLVGIIKAQLGVKQTNEMKTLLTWQCHVSAIVVGQG